MKNNQNFLSTHWADIAAFKLIKKEDKELYTVAAGVSPSGKVHIGNFRELITAQLVVQSLEKMGKKVRFLFSWDDFDVFRKIPAGFPEKINEKSVEGYLGMPLCDIPDCQKKYNSYAEANEKPLEASIKKLGVCPQSIYQCKQYRSGQYVEGILKAMRMRKVLKAILNRFRQHDLADDWFPLSVYCKNCCRDNTKIVDFNEESKVSYCCELCDFTEKIDLRNNDRVKLPWRIDWPMRWAYERVDFEPGGKDHSSEGGSFDTAKEIAKEVYSFQPPEFLHYDFVKIRGKGGKISSSSGDVITVDDLLEVYEPEIIRHFFASVRPNVELSIDLGEEVIKNYDVYDRLELQYFGKKPNKPEKEKLTKRVYEMCQIGKIGSKMAYQPAFRHLANVVQIYSFDTDKVIDYYRLRGYIKDEVDKKKLRIRSEKAINWIKKYIGEEYCFTIREKPCDFSQFLPEYFQALVELRELALDAKEKNIEEKEFFDKIYELIKKNHLDNVDFFKVVYQCCVGKDSGPRIASFLLILDAKTLSYLLPKC